MKINIPTALTLLRIALIPVLIVVFYLPIPGARTLSALVFLIAAFSDWLAVASCGRVAACIAGARERRVELGATSGAWPVP